MKPNYNTYYYYYYYYYCCATIISNNTSYLNINTRLLLIMIRNVNKQSR